VQRQIAIDRARVDRMRQIVSQLYNDQSQRNRKDLPANIDEVRTVYSRVGDPETDQPFEYRVKDASRYELCANFSAESEDWQQNPNSRSRWAHPAGHYCYTIDWKTNPWVD
jgi:hypothetical protein